MSLVINIKLDDIELEISYTVDPHLSEHLGTKGWLDMPNLQITETGVNAL